MFTILSYVVLAFFLGGSIYFLGLMFYLVLRKDKGRIKPLDPKGIRHPKLPKAA